MWCIMLIDLWILKNPCIPGIKTTWSWCYEKFLKRWEYQTTLLFSWKTCMWVNKRQNLHGAKDWFQIGKGIQQCLSPAYLTYMQRTSWEMPGCRTHKLESRFLGEISTTSDMQRTPQLWQKVKNLVSWWRWKRRVKKLTWNSTFKINLVWKSTFKKWHLVPSLYGK